MELLIALLVAALICAGICLVAWGVLAIIGAIPVMPAFVARIIIVVVWVVAGLACIIVLARALTGEPVLTLLLGV